MIKCKECEKVFSRYSDLSKHVNIFHDGVEKYYNKWIKKEGEGICKICGSNAKFRNLTHGYNYVCSNKECLHKFKSENIQKGLMKKYGVHASVYVEEIKEKQQKTCNEKYGVPNPLSSKLIQDKSKKTNLEKYGCENPGQNEKIKEKIKKTMMKNHCVNSYLEKTEEVRKGLLKKYGVEYAQQDQNIHIKQQISGFKVKHYKNTDLYFRGSYELDFLENFYDKIGIENGPSVKYRHKSKNKIYHSDFYIPSKNLVVEIKNSYNAEKDKHIIKSKRKATMNEGFGYIMIVDKDYSEFLKFFQ